MTTVERGGHFLALDRPQELRDLIVRFAAAGDTIQRGAQRAEMSPSLKKTAQTNVRFGSKADLSLSSEFVRFGG